MHDLTAFRRDILYAIAGLDEEPYGLAIKTALEAYYGEDIEPGHLYPNLDALVEEGFVEKGSIDKRTNSYTLSQRARREIQARRAWEDTHIGEEHLERPTP